MDNELQEFEFADPYVDNILIGSTGENMDEAIKNHEKNLRAVLEKFKKDKLVVEVSKSHFSQPA